jgi:AcrR family transcriptional regulator
MDEKTETRLRILDAAGKRFMHYGYQKTTMSEIARDLSMSTGNLYRFFESKLDIAEAGALTHEQEEDAMYEAIASSPGTAEERLKRLAREVLEYTYQVIAESNKVFEIAQAISRERPAYANRRLAAERRYIMRILEDGIAEGRFEHFADIHFTAEMFQSALMKFRYPQLYNCYNLENLRRELAGVLDLLMTGLHARAHVAESASAN